MRRPTTAVTAQDYEEIVKAVPGLCIRQVKAVRDEAENSVSIAVQPFSEEPYPALSPVYEEQILHWLEHRRLVSVRLRLLQRRVFCCAVILALDRSFLICRSVPRGSASGQARLTERIQIAAVLVIQRDAAGFRRARGGGCMPRTHIQAECGELFLVRDS